MQIIKASRHKKSKGFVEHGQAYLNLTRETANVVLSTSLLGRHGGKNINS